MVPGSADAAGACDDAWLSRSMLIYLDAIEANVGKVVQALRAGGTEVAVTHINLARDRGQNQARALKTLGWLALAAGFGLQIAWVATTLPRSRR